MTKAAERFAHALIRGPHPLTREDLRRYIEAQEKQAELDERLGRCSMTAKIRAAAARRALELLENRCA